MRNGRVLRLCLSHNFEQQQSTATPCLAHHWPHAKEGTTLSAMLSYAQTYLANNGMLPQQSPFIEMINVSYCGLEEQTLTLLLRSVRANCALKVLKLQGNNLSGKGTFILSEQLYSPLAMQVVFLPCYCS